MHRLESPEDPLTRPRRVAAWHRPPLLILSMAFSVSLAAAGFGEVAGADPHEAGPADVSLLPGRGVIPSEYLPPLDPDDPSAGPAFPIQPVPGRRAVLYFPLPSSDRLLPPRAVAAATVVVERFAFAGNTVIPDEELAATLASFVGRPLDTSDLDQVRFLVTQGYLEAGYVSSGAMIRDPSVHDGTLTVQVTEGRLTEAFIKGTSRLRTSYLSDRVLRGNEGPLNFGDLQQRLQVLQTNPNIQRINAELKPAPVWGEALIHLEVEETDPWSYGVDVHNQRPPASGSEQIDLWARSTNLSGVSDTLYLRYGLLSGGFEDTSFSGTDNLYANYQRPIFADDTSLDIRLEKQDYLIIDEIFAPLDMEGETWRVAGGLRRPFLRSFDNADGRSTQNEVWLSLMLELSHSETSVLGDPFTISPGAVNGELDLTVLRFGQEWTRRTERSVLALRSTLSAGLEIFGATERNIEPDSEFFSWRMNGQYLRRLSGRGDTLLINGGLQLSDGPLPSPEQATLGGRYTVRGYRENLLVRDRAAFAGIEYRCPLGEADSNWKFALAPFFDAGIGWNSREARDEYLLGGGLGLLVDYKDWMRGEVYWGHDIHELSDESDNLQDIALHFRLTVAKF